MPTSVGQDGEDLDPTGLEDNIIIVSEEADIILHLKDEKIGFDQKYQCCRHSLREASGYMNVLLDPAKFCEGAKTEAAIQQLSARYGTSALVPSKELPTAVVRDMGEVTNDVKFMTMVIKAFLMAIHGMSPSWPLNYSQSVHFIALFAILADRFAALIRIREYISNHVLDKVRLTERKAGLSQVPSQPTELEARQKLLAGLILEYPEWVQLYSTTLIVQGSKVWTCQSADRLGDAPKVVEGPLWLTLPRGIEEELMARREYILETIGSIQSHFIGLYSSKKIQCKLGYGNSKECDSFQLGEMIRFFLRKGLLHLQSTLVATEDSRSYSGNIQDLLARLRECPAYQIDPFHSHCGLRSRLLPLLYNIKPFTGTGINLLGWNKDRVRESWLDNPTGGTWSPQIKSAKTQPDISLSHEATKAMYTANDRDWTPSLIQCA